MYFSVYYTSIKYSKHKNYLLLLSRCLLSLSSWEVGGLDMTLTESRSCLCRCPTSPLLAFAQVAVPRLEAAQNRVDSASPSPACLDKDNSTDHRHPETANRAQLQIGQRAVGFFFSFNLDCLSLNQQACSNDRIRLWLRGGIHWCGLHDSACHTPSCTSSLSRALPIATAKCAFPTDDTVVFVPTSG